MFINITETTFVEKLSPNNRQTRNPKGNGKNCSDENQE